jgi:hypothetical protein
MQVALTSVYNDTTAITNTEQALSKMVATYASNTWHYNDGLHYPDLHHAFIFRNLGGGLTVFGGLCSSQHGYGVSSGIEGSLATFPYGEMYWVREEPFLRLLGTRYYCYILFALNLCFHFIPIQY